MGEFIKGAFPNVDILMTFLTDIEKNQCSHFIHRRSFADFRKPLHELNFDPTDVSRRKVKFKDGVGIVAVGAATMHCQYSRDFHIKGKERYSQQVQEKLSESVQLTTRTAIQESWKLGCPAAVHIMRYIRYPSHRLDKEKPTATDLKKASRRLRASPGSDWQEVFAISIPQESAHENHPIGEGSSVPQHPDRRVLEKLRDLVLNLNVTDVKQMENHLIDYVETTLFTRETAPPRTNTRYYPKTRTIYNHIYSTLAKSGYGRPALKPKSEKRQHKTIPMSLFEVKSRKITAEELVGVEQPSDTARVLETHHRSIRELLTEIDSFTYLNRDVDTAAAVVDMLADIKTLCYRAAACIQ